MPRFSISALLIAASYTRARAEQTAAGQIGAEQMLGGNLVDPPRDRR